MNGVIVTGVHLLRHGDNVSVMLEISGQWIEVIREPHDANMSHIVESEGIMKAWAAKAGQNRADSK